jgi:HD-GYP domain-containing protein (c-di-GMP phosphodiesterase class II)
MGVSPQPGVAAVPAPSGTGAVTDIAGAHDTEEPTSSPAGRLVPWFVASLIALVAVISALSSTAPITDSPATFLLLLASVVALDVVRVDLFERANVSPASVPTLALAYLYGPLGPVASELAIAALRAIRHEKPVRWAFDLGALGLAGAAAAVVYRTIAPGPGGLVMVAAMLGGLTYYAVNVPLLTMVMSLSEGIRPLAVWRERLAWLWPHFTIFGLLAGGIVLTQRVMGSYALLVFTAPLAVVWLTEKQYVDRSRSSVTELRRSNEQAQLINRQLRSALVSNEQLMDRMRNSHLATIASLARTIEAKDPYTGGHTDRVARLACLLAEDLCLDDETLQAIEVGGVIHDIGKIGIPDSILLKPGRLTEEEFAEMRRHPEISSYILERLDVPDVVRQMVRSHHERYDGAGYPDGLGGENIPLVARILCVADALDAMTTDRPYRRALPLDVAVAEVRDKTGSQFCPTVAAALAARLETDQTLEGMYPGSQSASVQVVRELRAATALDRRAQSPVVNLLR